MQSGNKSTWLRWASDRFGQLNLPPYPFKIEKQTDGGVRIYDRLRRRFVTLTPEEWVRQHFVAMLIDKLGYPDSMMANEVPLTLNDTSRRCDTVAYSLQGLKPLMIIEYKAPNITINQRTFDQIVRYNMVLQVPWLVVSNGMQHYCCRVDINERKVDFLDKIPAYSDLTLG